MNLCSKRVAIFITSLRGGGAERITSYLLNEGYLKYEFHLILLHADIEYSLPISNRIRIFCLEGSSVSKYWGVLKIPLLARNLKKYLIDNNISTLLTLLNRPNLIACYTKKLGWRGKLIISERVNTQAYYRSVSLGFFMTFLTRRYYPYADFVIAISRGVASSLQSLGVKNCKVIYNPVPNSAFLDNARPTEPEFTFINVSRLEPQKNHSLLLRAFAALGRSDSKLVIVGRGSLLGVLAAQAARLGIADRVLFTGFQSDIGSWLKKSSCFVFTSNFEGFGNVITEALSFGVPVISTDCPSGPREILAPETDPGMQIKDGIEFASCGLLTPVGDVHYLAAAMKKMMSSESLRANYRRRSLERVADFDIGKISQQYFDLL